MQEKKLENVAEDYFKKWLDSSKVPYWYIRQDLETFSPALKKCMAKRPDFMILIPNFGFLLVDVEDQKPVENYDQFRANCEEAKKYSILQRLFNIHVWYAFSYAACRYQTWYWIPVSSVLECVYISPSEEQRAKGYTDFFVIPFTDCIQVATDDSLERLFSRIFKKS